MDLGDFSDDDSFPTSGPENTEEDLIHDSDMDSEYEEINNEPGDSQMTRRKLYQNSGRSYGTISGDDKRMHDLIQKPWNPFRGASEFKLAQFFVEANVSWEWINFFMKASLALPDV